MSAPAPIKLELIAPGREPVFYDSSGVTAPGAAGIFTVLKDHAPLITTLTHGTVIADLPDDEKAFIAVHRGIAEVADNHVTIVADRLELADEIDTKRAQAALERARERLEKRDDRTDVARAEAALARALARLKARSQELY